MLGPEKKVEIKIRKYIQSLGGYSLKTLGGSVPIGTPDLIACINGYFIAIEVKREKGGRVTPIQLRKIQDIKDAGGIAFVANNVELVKENLQNEGVI